jgi:integrase
MTVKCGCGRATIYKFHSKRGYDSFQVRYFRGTEEVKFTRASFEQALEEAQSAARSIANGELDVLTLRSDDRLAYIRSIEALKPTGVGIERATREFAEAHGMLGGDSLVDAVRFYIKRKPSAFATKNVAEVAAELLQQKKEKGRCEDYLKDMAQARPICRCFPLPDREHYNSTDRGLSAGLKVSGRTQNNFRRLIGTLFRFAIKRGYLAKDHPGVTEVELATELPPDIEIFTCEEMGKLLGAAEPDIIPFVTLGGFAGLRHAEIKRLDWADIQLGEGHVALKAKDSKTRIRRLIPIHENLRLWLTPYAQKFGPVVPYANMSKQLLWLADDAGVPWKHNALRHSFVSYRVAETQNIPQTSYESGNTPRSATARINSVWTDRCPAWTPVCEAE